MPIPEECISPRAPGGNEARIAAGLQHPAILPVYDVDLADGRWPYFTMQVVEGTTLASVLEARKDPSELLPAVRLQPEKGARIPTGILRGWLRLPLAPRAATP